MDEILIELVVADLQKNSDGIDLFSKEYFFDKKYAEHRSTIVMFGGPLSHRSRLSLLCREGMNEARRQKIFTSNYDLGNMRNIAPNLCTYKKLADELYGIARWDLVANDLFETVQKGVYQITGRTMREHFRVSKSTTIKVLKTLHLVNRYRGSELLQLLNSPMSSSKFSMSFRDAYPYLKNQDQVWLIADLKAYMSVELSDERIQKISRTYNKLHGWFNQILEDVELTLFRSYQFDYASMVSSYSTLEAAAAEFQFKRELNNTPIDEELFTHIHGLEEANFYAGIPQLFKVAIPQCSVLPVWKEMRKLANELFHSETNGVHETDPKISLTELPVFALQWRKEIVVILEKAMCKCFDLGKFRKITFDSQNLLRMLFWFKNNGARPFRDDSKLISIWEMMAAFCCVWYSHTDTTNFKPYWHGQVTQGGSLNASNKTQGFVFGPNIDNIPEEHRHIWAYRYQWFADALRGHMELKEKKFGFRSAIATKLLEICNMSNVERISKAQVDFDRYIRGHILNHNQEN